LPLKTAKATSYYCNQRKTSLKAVKSTDAARLAFNSTVSL
jgi:hypothetical protein